MSLIIQGKPRVFYIFHKDENKYTILDYINTPMTSDEADKRRAQLVPHYFGHEVLIGDPDVIFGLYYDTFVKPPVEISRERYNEMLDVLPPEDWSRGESSESFKMCEYDAGPITAIYVKMEDVDGGWSYYEMHDYGRLNHSKLMAKLAQHTPVNIMDL